MPHRVQNFDYHAGDNTPLRITVLQSDGATPVDFGATPASEITFALAASRQAAAPLFSKTLGAAEIAVITPSAGLIEVTLVKADTVALDGFYFYEVEVQFSAGEDETVLTGEVTIPATVID